MIDTITNDNFESIVLKSDRPFLVEFWASWCAPCTMMAATIDALDEKYSESLAFGKLNSDENPDIVERYEVRGLPTLLLFVNGKVEERFVGLVPRDNIERILQFHI